MTLSNPAVNVDHPVLETFFLNSAEGALVINRLRKILNVNPGATQITGWKQRDLTSINCNVFMCRDEHGKRTCEDKCLAQQCIEGGQQIGPMYLRLTRADGTSVAVEATYRALPAASCLLHVKDLTMLELLDANVRRLDGALAERNMVIRGISDQMSLAWRAALLDLRTGAETLRAHHAKELGDAGGKVVERMVGATRKLEETFAQLKSQIAAAMQGNSQKKVD